MKINNIKVGNKLWYVSAEFDGCSLREVEVTDKSEDHILCRPTDPKDQDITLWFDNEDINKSLTDDYNVAIDRYREGKKNVINYIV